MRNLVHFIYKNIHWLLFGLLIYLSVFLIVKNNHFQRSKYLQAVQNVTGGIYSVTNRVYSYLHLKSVNAELLQRMAQLEMEVYAYRHRFADELSNSEPVNFLDIDSLAYVFIPAQVVMNSISRLDNYLMLNKGSNDGIQRNMGVISANGIVGVIDNTSAHFSTVASLLHTKYKPSGMIKNNDSFGPLVWDGKSVQYTYLTKISRHIVFEPGDTVVTSGHSAVFPKGIPIGTIVDEQKQKQQDDNYKSLRIRLFTDFSRLSDVFIVTNRFQKEQLELEKRTLESKLR